jgi:hypothetical protein
VRELGRAYLIAILIVALVGLPAMGAPSKPLGLVIQAQAAQLGSTAAAAGSTVYAGDSLGTDTGGSLRMRIGPAQLYLLSASVATLGETSAGVNATLVAGTAGFLSPSGPGIELRTDLGTIRAKAAQSTHARVTVVSPNEILITSYRGPLEVETDGETFTAAEGNTYRLVADPQDSGVKSARHRRRALLFWVAVIGVGVPVAVWAIHELVESPTKPE